MALKFFQSFDIIAAGSSYPPYYGWTNATIYWENSQKRFSESGGSMYIYGYPGDRHNISRSPQHVTGSNVVYAGFAMKQTANQTDAKPTLGIVRGTNYHLELMHNSNNTISLYHYESSTVLGTSTQYISLNRWYHYEIECTIHTSNGSAAVYVDGVLWLSVSGVATQHSSEDDKMDSVCWYNPRNGYQYMADFYFGDNTGTVNNTRLGECRIDVIWPTGAGTHTDWTPNTGANYAAVDEKPFDGDTTYVESLVSGEKDTYVFGDLSDQLGADVFAMSLTTMARKASTPATKIAHSLRLEDAVDRTSGEYVLAGAYFLYESMFELSPRTGLAWTEQEINSGEYGFEFIT